MTRGSSPSLVNAQGALLPRQRGIASPGGRSVLVVGINYAPEPTGIAPYTTAVAEHLAEQGDAVEVLTGLPCYPTWEVPAEFRRGLRFDETRAGVHVRRLKHTVPQRQDALRRGAYEFSFMAHAAGQRVARRPDVVLGITPALGGAVAAALIAQRHNARLVLIVQDLLGCAATQSGIAGGGRVAAVVQRMESFVLRRADAVAVVTDAFRAQLANYGVTDDRIHLVPNWTHVGAANADRATTRASMGWSADVKVALHTGNMGLKQDLGNIVEAARLTAHRKDLRWVLMGDGSQRSALQQQSAGLPNLDFLPLCDQETYANILSAADVLLLNEGPGVAEMSLPSKLTSYFTSGVPVAAAVCAGGATERELANAGATKPVRPGQPRALVDLVDSICTDPTAATALAAAAQRYADSNLTRGASLALITQMLRHEQ